jgi:hypothetical protein
MIDDGLRELTGRFLASRGRTGRPTTSGTRLIRDFRHALDPRLPAHA